MSAEKYETIKFNVENGVAAIIFNLPEYSNALTLHAIEELLDALFEAEANKDVGAILITGEGRAFCAGFNLKEIPDADKGIDEIRSHFRVLATWWHQALHLFVRIPKPVLVAVNGYAAGSGLGMTLCADLAVCSENSRFLCAWHSIGLANDATTSYSLAKIVGFRRAVELMFTNRTLTSSEALDWGLVNRVYADDELRDKAFDIARQLADGPTHLQAMAKESFHMGWRRSIEEATEYEIQNVLTSVEDPYFEKCLQKFLDGKGKSDMQQLIFP